MMDLIKSKIRLMLSNGDLYLMMAPFLILFLMFTVIPVMSSVLLSFTDFNLLEWPSFVGWDNYVKLFLEDKIFTITVKNTLLFALLTGPLSYFLSLFVAWMVNDLSPKIRTLFTFMFYAPSISGTMYFIWSLIFSGDIYGWVNGFLINTGILNEPVAWLNDSRYSLSIIMLVQLWMSMGAGFLAFIAGLQSIDRTLYESGSIDGVRNRWQELIYITLPSMGPQLLFGAVMQISASFSAGRISIALAGNPSTDYAANTIITHVIDYATIRYEMGYASAIATVLFMLMLITNSFIRRVLRKYN
ncbi:MAG: sugar ABC transporter permease [Eubacteriales bacterium]|nr:sugar ABC transporter permease [Eubacteriales bacterium]MDD4717773.1 sugar ABC transporter permease [Eubacteriales bacterium]